MWQTRNSGAYAGSRKSISIEFRQPNQREDNGDHRAEPGVDAEPYGGFPAEVEHPEPKQQLDQYLSLAFGLSGLRAFSECKLLHT